MEVWCARKWCSNWRNIENCRGVPPPLPPCLCHPPARLQHAKSQPRTHRLHVSRPCLYAPRVPLISWHIGHCGKQQGEATHPYEATSTTSEKHSESMHLPAVLLGRMCAYAPMEPSTRTALLAASTLAQPGRLQNAVTIRVGELRARALDAHDAQRLVVKSLKRCCCCCCCCLAATPAERPPQLARTCCC
jgi:hypothetical protein